MQTLKFDLSKGYGKFKPLNATNGGPWAKSYTDDQLMSNFNDYKKARMAYSRTHDSALSPKYGGQFAHDILNIFPDFDADPYNPSSYDFACTDESLLITIKAGTQIFFRLGQSIENIIKKHNVYPPKDFKKWAIICEHIIKHYNEGWADGFNMNIEYWEIWNEADGWADAEIGQSPTWCGTKEQFFEFYATAATHLKNIFPHLKIGGPALAWNEPWADEFLAEMKKRDVKIDFFSWHMYTVTPEQVIEKAESIQALLIKHGYEESESILDEWNYVEDWTDEFLHSLEMVHSLKNASFILSVMALSQPSTIDMLMYYDTRPSTFNGIFDFYTAKPLKGYYPMMWYGNFYDLESEIRSENQIENIYALCGTDKNGKTLTMLTYYSKDNEKEPLDISIDFGRGGNYEIYLVDNEHNGELIKTTDKLEFTLSIHSCIMIKEV